MKNFVTKKYIKIALVLVFCICVPFILAGCVSMPTGIYIENYPTKIVYQKNERVDYSGLTIKTINTDGTHRKVYFNQNEFPDVDTSTSGVKKVTVLKNGFNASFNFYVADVVVNDSDNLKQIFASLQDGDVVYMRAGDYSPQSENDQSYKDVEITKSITLVGDGMSKTKFYGNFLIGATVTQNGFEKIENFKDVTIRDIGFKLDYQQKDGLIYYDGPYGNTDTNGAIRFFDTKNLTILKCSFDNYAYGIYGDSADGLSLTKNKFTNIFKSAIYTKVDTKNTLISKNIFVDTAQNFVSFVGNEQESLGAIIISFANEGLKGVNICKNTINRTGFHRGEVAYYDQNSKDMAQNTNQKLFELTYINNTGCIIFRSSGEKNLVVGNVVLSANNIGQALANIKFGTNSQDNVNASGITILE